MTRFGVWAIPDSISLLARVAAASARGWAFSETVFLHSGLPFSLLSHLYTATNASGTAQGIFQASGRQFARRVPGVPVYRRSAYPGVTVAAPNSG